MLETTGRVGLRFRSRPSRPCPSCCIRCTSRGAWALRGKRKRGRGDGRERERERESEGGRSAAFRTGRENKETLARCAATSNGDVDASTKTQNVIELLQRPANRRRVTSCDCAEESLYELLEIGKESESKTSDWNLHFSTLKRIMEMIVEDGNPKLAVDMFRVLDGGSRSQVPFKWTFDGSEARSFLLIRLIRSLYDDIALTFLEDSCKVSLPGRRDQVSFGSVVPCPSCDSKGLSVVKTFHGPETVACSSCRFQFDLYSGVVVKSESEPPEISGSLLEDILKKRFGGGGRPDCMTHTVNIESPDGSTRAYKFATEDDDIPAKVGDRVTITTATDSKDSDRFGGLAPIPPGWRRGEPKAIYNHRLSKTTELFRPPNRDSGISLQWIVLGTALFAGGDASSSLINPDFPALIAAGTVGITAASAVAKEVVLPQLAKLPPRDLAVLEYRQQFLEQYDVTKGKLDELLVSTYEDIQLLSRLWTLHHKIEAVGSFGGGSYDARVQKIINSASSLEERLNQSIRMVEGYSKIQAMIEIEIELDADIEAAEVRSAITGEMYKLEEMETTKEEWDLQVDARNEVEKLLNNIE